MLGIFTGKVNPKTKKLVHVSEDVLHLFLHLNNKQNLLMRYQSANGDDHVDYPFVSQAVWLAPARFVEVIYAQNPAALKEPITDGRWKLSVVGMLSERIKQSKTANEFQESMKVLEVLLVDAKINLLEIDVYSKSLSSHFEMLWEAAKTANHDLNLLKKTIIEKRGEEEWNKCLELLKL